MATTNYSLPTLESTALFDLVTDYNALANATDAALAQVAGLIPTETITTMQGQISALQTSVAGNSSNIMQLQGQMSTANDKISTLSTGLQTANNSIGTLQSGLQTTNNNLAQTNDYLSKLLKFNTAVVSSIQGFSISSGQTITIFYNEDKTLIKLAGSVTHTGTATRQQIPGSQYYGFELITDLVIPTTESINYIGTGIAFSETNSVFALYGAQNVVLGTNGKLYINPATVPNFKVTQTFNITLIQTLLTVKNLNTTMDTTV